MKIVLFFEKNKEEEHVEESQRQDQGRGWSLNADPGMRWPEKTISTWKRYKWMRRNYKCSRQGGRLITVGKRIIQLLREWIYLVGRGGADQTGQGSVGSDGALDRVGHMGDLMP